jgi:histidinol phosphatase-like enzyme (inositol monophosphatase family)
MSDPATHDVLATAIRAAEAAGDRAMRWFGADPETSRKADGSPVTVADREAEAAARAVVRSAFPDHGILGEEEDEEASASGWRWIVDPIDGTESFMRGVPLFGSLIAVEHDGEVVAGVCHMPAIGETVAAARGLGCRWNGRICRVSDVAELSKATLVCTSPRANRRRTPRYVALEESVARVRGWSDCYAYMLVATGRADIAIDPVMKPWDCGPFLPILEEAGGRFTDWRGRRTIHGGDAIASNGRLHALAGSVLCETWPSE